MANEKRELKNVSLKGGDSVFVTFTNTRFGRRLVKGPHSKRSLGRWVAGDFGWIPSGDFAVLKDYGFKECELPDEFKEKEAVKHDIATADSDADVELVRNLLNDSALADEIAGIDYKYAVESDYDAPDNDDELFDVDAITGIGPTLKDALAEKGFTSVKSIAEANIDDLIIPEKRFYRGRAESAKEAARELLSRYV